MRLHHHALQIEATGASHARARALAAEIERHQPAAEVVPLLRRSLRASC